MQSDLVIQPSTYNLASVDHGKMKRMTEQLVSSVTGANGKALTPIQAAQIALITLTTDLSPFLGEVYATDKGVMIGVVAYERKGQEYLDAFHPGDSYHVYYRDALPGKDADFDPARGDVGFVCRVERDDWTRAWTSRLHENMRQLKEIGIVGLDNLSMAKELTGDVPYTEFVGVVDARENFSGVYQDGQYRGENRPEAFDRYERARKRARKGALKHTFPRLSIPDPLKVLAEDRAVALVEMAATEAGTRQPVQIPAGMTTEEYAAQLTKQLGYPAPAVIETQARPAQSDPDPVVTSARPYAAPVVREKLLSIAAEYDRKGVTVEEKIRGVVRANLETCFADRDAAKKRKTVYDYLFGEVSTAKLTAGQVQALHKWLDARPDASGEWRPNEHSVTEARALYTAALEAQGQGTLL